MCAMSFESPRSSVFTFQSSVHGSHVLRCLDEQRKRDVLCDVTVVVEDQSFRAHRSVLASCSKYFHTRVTSLVGQGLVITLPDEVTVEGFDPLLQFAYTAKLLFTKTNILEIHKCATTLGFHNLDKACFDFLMPKFFDSSRSAQASQQKVCCKSKYWKEKSSKANTGADIDDDDDDNDNEEVKEESKDTDCLDPLQKKCTAKTPAPSTKTKEDASGLICTDIATPTDSTLLCPKYRKFQKACGKQQFCSDRCSPQVPSSSSSSSLAPARKENPSPLRICPVRDETEDPARSIFREQKTDVDKVSENEAAVAAVCPPHAPPLPVNPNPTGFGEMTDSGRSPSVGLAGTEPDCCAVGSCERHFLSHAAGREGSGGGERPMGSDPVTDRGGGGERSSVEREVAEHLAQGPWSESLHPAAQFPMGESTGCCWFKQLELPPGTTDCPFFRDLAMEQGPSQTDEMPYDSSLNSGDDSDFDTEGASECYSSERAHNVCLPFPVEQIVSLSRHEFQRMVKQHQLTREQLDFVHDVRRRSKNCIAARRCRKRKMDRIHNLECEIEKLRCEKEKLTQERNQLNHVKLKTWHDISSLYQKVCSEAALRPEQLQVLARYSTPDCPLSALLAPAPSASPGPGPQVPPSTSDRLPTEPPAGETPRGPQVPLPVKLVPAANHSRTLGGLGMAQSPSQTSTWTCFN